MPIVGMKGERIMEEKSTPKKRGRPVTCVDGTMVTFTAPGADRELWKHKAQEQGLTLSAWIRKACNYYLIT
jgi:hypothetical protein